MDLRQIEEDREASLVFLGMKPGTFDGTQGAAALVEWLHDMETIFGLYHIKAHLQVMLASRRLNPEVPLASAAPAGLQADPPMVREDLLYEWFRRMKAPEFEGLTDPIEADNWIIDIQVILDFMGLTELEKVLCASFALKKNAQHWWMTVQMHRNVATMSLQDFVTEFRAMYYNREVLAAQ
uniref:Retrotransposon gag domain-containing protein n=1 Tax=Ficus carica TaxID=3494 RepID=A0AA88JD98_FICCA|nr:hypothetical protein TIFTF001_036972 [Ficus carica]